jgi:hypothetical protein
MQAMCVMHAYAACVQCVLTTAAAAATIAAAATTTTAKAKIDHDENESHC